MKNSTSFNLVNLTIRELSKGISTGDVSPVDLVEASLQRITRLNPYTASILYIACKETGEHKPQKVMASAAGVTEVTIRNRIRDLVKNLNLPIV